MAKKKKSKKTLKKINYGWIWKVASILFVLLAVVLLYALQPVSKRQEMKRLGAVCFHDNASVGLSDIVSDIWTLCFGRGLVPCDLQPEPLPVYGGIPSSQSPLNILRNDAYWVGYSEEKRTPLWAAYRLFDSPPAVSTIERAESFLPDFRTSARITSDFYTNSGYDRGHLASNYSIAKCFGDAAQKQTFLMSNVVPQRHALNAGIWKSLEKKEIDTYAPRCQTIWVIAGPIYPSVAARTIPSGLPIPEAFFKIILDDVDGRLRAMAFIFPHDMEKGVALKNCLVSIDEIEQRTGLDFFPELPKDVQTALESPVSTKIW